MSGECQVHVKSQSELDIGGRETCSEINHLSFDFDKCRSKSQVQAPKSLRDKSKKGKVKGNLDSGLPQHQQSYGYHHTTPPYNF